MVETKEAQAADDESAQRSSRTFERRFDLAKGRMKPKTTREHIISLYGHISGVKKNLSHVHEDVENLGGKIDKVYWVLLTVAGTAVIFVAERLVG